MKDSICKQYIEGMSIEDLCKQYHIGKLKVKQILNENNVSIRGKGGRKTNKVYLLHDWSIEKYPKDDGYYYEAISKDGRFTSKDYMNTAGILTSYIKKHYNIEIPTLYDRREYYKITGNYWWEQWFDIIKRKKEHVKKCPYCAWETIDINNKSGAFEVHLKNVHNKTKFQYIQEYPQDKSYFNLVSLTLNRQLCDNKDDYVECQICGRKLSRIDNIHLSRHNMTKYEYINKFPMAILVSNNYHRKMHNIAIKTNSSIKKTFESQYEKEIKQILKNCGIECSKNRSVLKGEELDIFIPSKNIAIEFNGIYWHQEKFGKDSSYHLNKLQYCNDNGVKLIQIFEDEYYNNKQLVLTKIKHILGLNQEYPKIMARRCVVQEIESDAAFQFLEENHIQGCHKSTIYLGCIYEGKLIGVMSFLKSEKNSNKWELTRFATLNGYLCIGVGGKLFKYFVKHYDPQEVKSFADRRWTIDGSNNLYTKLGFTLEKILKPNYSYYNSKVNKFKRYHKFNFRKQILSKKYGFPLTMSEKEMTRELGYDRIWDCGLFKYVWKK